MNKHPLQDRIDNFLNLSYLEQYNLYSEFVEGMLVNFYIDALQFDETCPQMDAKEFAEKFREFTKFWVKCRLKPSLDELNETKDDQRQSEDALLRDLINSSSSKV